MLSALQMFVQRNFLTFASLSYKGNQTSAQTSTNNFKPRGNIRIGIFSKIQ